MNRRSKATPLVESSSVTGTSRRGLGPQSSSGSVFAKRMRLHQSWYRAEVLELPFGVGPEKSSKKHFGNMLGGDDGQRGRNFLTEEIFEVVRERLVRRVGVVKRYRLLHNMMSSQPMCFNLLGPLVRDRQLATILWRQILGDEVESVERVDIEWAPGSKKDYLADGTAFDGFVEYRRPDGKSGFIGIETKLTDSFTDKTFDKPEYRRWMTSDSPWRSDAASRVSDVRYNQLWRDHLLAVAMLNHPRSTYAAGHLMLVSHPEDRSCRTTVAEYQALLRPGDRTFVDMPLDKLVAAWRLATPDHAHPWLDAFFTRYLDLEKSEQAWRTR